MATPFSDFSSPKGSGDAAPEPTPGPTPSPSPSSRRAVGHLTGAAPQGNPLSLDADGAGRLDILDVILPILVGD